LLISAKPFPNSVGKVPGLDVYILIFTASIGQSKTSAINSALPEANDQPTSLYFVAFSSPTAPLKTSLKIS